jgi:GxxExxY protein
MTENELSNIVIGHAITVHRNLRPDLPESVYEECLVYEMTKNRLFVEKHRIN